MLCPKADKLHKHLNTGYNYFHATQLEDWLVDIETAVNLSAECRSKLALAKSKD